MEKPACAEKSAIEIFAFTEVRKPTTRAAGKLSILTGSPCQSIFTAFVEHEPFHAYFIKLLMRYII